MTPYVHHVPGRIRIKIPTLKGDEVQTAIARALLHTQNGVLSCEANAVTGSLLIRYDEAETNAYRLLDVLRQGGYIGPTAPMNRPAPAGEALSGVGKALGKAFVGAMIDKVIERSAAALVGAAL